ncbi:MAG: hypothetical protein KME14_04310 [Tildeniella torsiva UHER 1998/13D]|nr:hypothetical protein [Tildeniella torsiva UHER 1998/13D]
MVINVNVHEPAIAQYFPPDLCDVTNDGYYSIYTTMRNGWCMETYRFNSSTTGETIHIVRASTYTDNGHKISVVRGGSAYNNRQYSFHLYNENGRILSFKVNSELIVEEDSIEGDLALANNFISYFSYGLEQITSISLPTTGNPF